MKEDTMFKDISDDLVIMINENHDKTKFIKSHGKAL